MTSTMSPYISLRNFGYSSTCYVDSRRDALIRATEAKGKLQVLNRLRYVAELCGAKNLPCAQPMTEDVAWFETIYNFDDCNIKLSDYGYKSGMTPQARHESLVQAVNIHGKEKVVKRLTYVLHLNAGTKRQVFQDDIDWLNTHCQENNSSLVQSQVASSSVNPLANELQQTLETLYTNLNYLKQLMGLV